MAEHPHMTAEVSGLVLFSSRQPGHTAAKKQSPKGTNMRALIGKLIRDEQGQDVIEYALLAAGISIIVVPTVPLIGDAVNLVYVRINGKVGEI